MPRTVVLQDPTVGNATLALSFYNRAYSQAEPAKMLVHGTTGVQGFSPHQAAQLILHASQWLLSLPPEDTDP